MNRKLVTIINESAKTIGKKNSEIAITKLGQTKKEKYSHKY